MKKSTERSSRSRSVYRELNKRCLKSLDTWNVPVPPAEPFVTARGWTAGFVRKPGAARAWLSKRWKDLKLRGLPKGPKNERVLRMIVIDEEVAGWVAIALRQSHADQKRFREAEIKKLNTEHERVQRVLDTLYDDRLEQRIDLAFFERKSRQWRDDQSAIRGDIERHQTATESFMEAGVRIIELSQRLHSIVC
jgi:hypothetical protein